MIAILIQIALPRAMRSLDPSLNWLDLFVKEERERLREEPDPYMAGTTLRYTDRTGFYSVGPDGINEGGKGDDEEEEKDR